jgi:Mg-chelatase subunit ChlD
MVPTTSNNAQSHDPPRNQNGNSNPFVIDRKRASVAEGESSRNVRAKTEPTAAATSNQASNNADETHVIFAIDFSSSMNVADVKSSDNNGSIPRWNAVFKCVESLIDNQLQEQDTVIKEEEGGEELNNRSKCLISLLIFNNESRVLIHKLHLCGDGTSVKEALRAAEKDNKPKGGTSFSAGFHEASILAEGYDNVLVVFLTDGRPGDLRPNPAVDSGYAMQAT